MTYRVKRYNLHTMRREVVAEDSTFVGALDEAKRVTDADPTGPIAYIWRGSEFWGTVWPSGALTRGQRFRGGPGYIRERDRLATWRREQRKREAVV